MRIDLVERTLFFEGLYLKYGYDFRQYAEASLDRRLVRLMEKRQCTSLIDLLKVCLNSREEFHQILPQLTVGTSEFFRDPSFFKALRATVFPELATYSSVRIWVAGCSSGQEVLSLCIALHECDLLRRAKIYATDIDPVALAKSKKAIYSQNVIADFNRNYTAAGGGESPSCYYNSDYELVQFDRRLLENVTFVEHNLVTDGTFVEAHLVLCRNVLIYFNRELQAKVVSLFARSLAFKGYLGLGSRESLQFTESARFFDEIDRENHLFKLRSVRT